MKKEIKNFLLSFGIYLIIYVTVSLVTWFEFSQGFGMQSIICAVIFIILYALFSTYYSKKKKKSD